MPSPANLRAFEAVRISSGLIAFYPQAITRPQPYVILLDPVSGVLKRLNLQTAKRRPSLSSRIEKIS